MKNLIVLSGIPGSGKSTFIKENGLEELTISTDQARMFLSSLVMNENGDRIINQGVSKEAFELLDMAMIARMKRGQTVIVDATNTRSTYFSKYKKLAEEYGYRTYVVDFDIDVNIAIERDSKRTFGKVGADIIKRMYQAKESLVIPSCFKKIKPEEFFEALKWRTENFDGKTVNVFGDIHGCYKPLMDFFEVHPFSEDEIYIFTGDYVDRGPNNDLVIEFLMNLQSHKNVIMLLGNHERHIINKFRGEHVSNEFEKTWKQISKFGNELRSFHRNLRQVILFERDGQEYFVSHGGFPKMPNLLFTSVEELTGGVGGYDYDLDQMWKDENNGFIQIHGHRNYADGNDRSITLEGGVERGGELRVWRNGIVEKYQNPVQSNDLENSPLIKTKELGKGIKSYNFTREAFWSSSWDNLTTKARGLFMREGEVVARSYEKFFNIGEMPETQWPAIISHKGGLDIYLKENGYLGIVSVIDGELHFFSKSTDEGKYAGLFKNIFNGSKVNPKFKEYLERNNCSAVFEVIDPKHDPHIIKYDNAHVVLLDVIKNDLDFQTLPYQELCELAKECGLQVKQHIQHLNSWKELQEINLDELLGEQEGIVAVGEDGFMCKYKTTYYQYWKKMRKEAERIRVNYHAKDKCNFTNWLENHLELTDFDIIQLREIYENKKNL